MLKTIHTKHYEHGNEQMLEATGKQRESLRSIMNSSILEQRRSPWLKKKRQSNNSEVTILNTP